MGKSRALVHFRRGPTISTAPADEALEAGLHVVHLVAEYWPYARSGGLAEAVRGIATFQARSGVPTVVLLPYYRVIRTQGVEVEPLDPIEVALGPARDRVQLLEGLPAVLDGGEGPAPARATNNP